MKYREELPAVKFGGPVETGMEFGRGPAVIQNQERN